VLDLLDAASPFWHGAGYARPSDHPEDAEHFGISIVEAMSRGAVPLVYADGGPLEYVDAQNGATWSTPAELADISTGLMTNPDALVARAGAAARDARRFDVEVFRREVRRLFP
jgi:glycosyltransferase involved in cell wall biosynthesis